MDDNIAVIGDWVLPSLTPWTFFSAALGDDIGMRPHGNNKIDRFGASDGMNLATAGDMETRPGNTGFGCSTEGSLPTEQRSNFRGSLSQRIAARAGFNAPRLNTEGMRFGELLSNPDVRSPYLTISPGLSPTTLLESPVFLSNSLVQPSPTTGKFPFFPNNIDNGTGLVSNASDGTKGSQFEGNGTVFAFSPLVESGGSSFFGSRSKVDARVHSESLFQLHNAEQSKVQPLNDSAHHGQNEYSRQPIVDGPDCSPPLDDHVEDEGDLNGGLGDPMVGVGSELADDGYNWRKYGQKQVRGSKYPRSYYKCTDANCQVKKKIERSHEGHITEIIYKGVHKHSKPLQDCRSVITGPDGLGEGPGDDGFPAWDSSRKAATAATGDWRPENNNEVMSSPSEGLEVIGNPVPSLPVQKRTHFGLADHVDRLSTFSNDEGEDDRQTHVSASMGNDGDGDEFESKRRKIEAYASDVCGATRAIREPRVVVQTTSEVDILDDGYRWRKYGQKVVKGNPNPRSYYKCTSAGCSVRKHVERASHDLKSVITTYEGKHNHDVPAARNSNHANPGTNPTLSNSSGIQTQVHRPEPSQLRNMMARLEGFPSLCPFNLPAARALGGPSQGHPFRMSQNGGLANLGIAGLGPGQGKLPMIPCLQNLLIQKRQANEMGLMLPKGEVNDEPMADASLNFSGSSTTIYQQMMGRLPPGQKM